MKPIILSAFTVASIVLFPHSLRAQGSLTPPGPPGPTMLTLKQVEPRTPISSLPYTISTPGSYYLTTNLTGISGNYGIIIATGNVTLDLNGFVMQGVPGSSSGIFVNASYTNLVIHNGALNGWGLSGVDTYSASYPRNMLIENLTVSYNNQFGIETEAGSIVRNCTALENGQDGIFSAGGEIIDCVCRNNGANGFTSYSGVLQNCLSEHNVQGFYLSDSRMLDCSCQFNLGEGVDCNGTGNEIRRCRLLSNSGTGIQIESGSGANVIEDCDISGGGAYGIYTVGNGGGYFARNNLILNSAGGIIMDDSNNYIEDNHVVSANGVEGIATSSQSYTNNVVTRNYVSGGGSASVNYSNPGLGSDFGPIGSAATATSPWANISH